MNKVLFSILILCCSTSYYSESTTSDVIAQQVKKLEDAMHNAHTALTEQVKKISTDNEKKQYKKLYRSSTNRVIAGVCGGIGEYLNIDPTVVRLLCTVTIICTAGTGILLYVLGWLIIPAAPAD